MRRRKCGTGCFNNADHADAAGEWIARICGHTLCERPSMEVPMWSLQNPPHQPAAIPGTATVREWFPSLRKHRFLTGAALSHTHLIDS